MAVGESIKSVFGGSADREAFGEADDFVAQQVPKRSYTKARLKEFEMLQSIRDLREGRMRQGPPVDSWKILNNQYIKEFSKHWLIGLELYELSFQFKELKEPGQKLKAHLETLATAFPHYRECISDGIRLADIVL
jgi:phenylalanine-4-hydroxylase